MSHQMFHINFMFPGVPKVLDLEPHFNGLGDWVRYSQTGWLLWTDKSARDLLHVLSEVIDPPDMLVISLMPQDGGFAAVLQPWMWNWIKTKMSVVTADDNPGLFARRLPGPQ